MEKNSKKRPKLGLAPLLATIGIVLVIFLLVVIANRPEKKYQAKGTIVCSFYPVYDMVSNLMENTGYDVVNMTSNMSGCIHDYQITTKDMKLIEKADLFVANGMGMEHFLPSITGSRKDLQVAFLTDAFEEAAAVNRDLSGKSELEGDNNPHLWMDVEKYLEECEYMKKFLGKKFPDAAAQIESNFGKYSRDARDAKDKAEEFPGLFRSYVAEGKLSEYVCAISFNEAFVPLAESLDIELIAEFSLDENEQPSAAEISEAINTAKARKHVLILIEKDKKSEADKILKEVDAQVVLLDPITSASGGEDLPKRLWNNLAEIDSAVYSLTK